MRILNRYILLEILGFFLGGLAVFTGLLLTARMLKFASLIVNKGVQFDQILAVFIAIVPTFLEIAIPLSALLGVMLAFARLSGDSELIVMRSSGIGLYQLIFPVILFGVLAAAINLYVSQKLRPWGYAQLTQSLFEIARSRSTAGLDEGVFNKLGVLTLYAENIEHDSGNLQKVLIDDRRNPEQRRIVTAQTGRITSNAATQTIALELFDGEIHESSGPKYTLTRYENNELQMGSDELFEGEDTPEERRQREMSGAELRRQLMETQKELAELDTQTPSATDPLATEDVAKEKASPEQEMLLSEKSPEEKLRSLERKIHIERTRRLSMPVAALILALVGMPLGVQSPRAQRTWGAGLSVTLGLLVFVLYYGFVSFGIALAENGALSPVAALWLPNLLSLGAALFMLTQMSSERWQSITHQLEALLQNIWLKISREKTA